MKENLIILEHLRFFLIMLNLHSIAIEQAHDFLPLTLVCIAWTQSGLSSSNGNEKKMIEATHFCSS